MAGVTVLARIEAKPGSERELEQELRKAVGPTHKEGGCTKYALHLSVDDPRTYFFVERWDSRKDLDDHLNRPHIKTLFSNLEHLSSSSDVWILDLLPERDPVKGGM